MTPSLFFQDTTGAAELIRDYDGSSASPIDVLIVFSIIIVILVLYWLYLTYFRKNDYEG